MFIVGHVSNIRWAIIDAILEHFFWYVRTKLVTTALKMLPHE